MSNETDTAPEYNGPTGGAYTTEEHVRAQAEQKSDAKPGKLVGDTAEGRPPHAEPTPAGIGDDINPDGSEHNDATGESATESNPVTGDQPVAGV